MIDAGKLLEWIEGLERAGSHFWEARKSVLRRDGARFGEYHAKGVMEVSRVLGSMRESALFEGSGGLDDKYITGASETLPEEEINDYIETIGGRND